MLCKTKRHAWCRLVGYGHAKRARLVPGSYQSLACASTNAGRDTRSSVCMSAICFFSCMNRHVAFLLYQSRPILWDCSDTFIIQGAWQQLVQILFASSILQQGKISQHAVFFFFRWLIHWNVIRRCGRRCSAKMARNRRHTRRHYCKPKSSHVSDSTSNKQASR